MLLFQIVLILSISNVVLSCILTPSNKGQNANTEMTNSKSKEVVEEIKKEMCSDCNVEAEQINKTFEIVARYNTTYKCHKCGKTWSVNEKEIVDIKQKRWNKDSRTLIDAKW